MTYRMPPESREAVGSTVYWTDDRIEYNLGLLRTKGPEWFDLPKNPFEEMLGTDYDGYTEQWINLLGAEKDRRIEAGTWDLHSRAN